MLAQGMLTVCRTSIEREGHHTTRESAVLSVRAGELAQVQRQWRWMKVDAVKAALVPECCRN